MAPALLRKGSLRAQLPLSLKTRPPVDNCLCPPRREKEGLCGFPSSLSSPQRPSIRSLTVLPIQVSILKMEGNLLLSPASGLCLLFQAL